MIDLPAKGERMNLDAENYQRMMDKAEEVIFERNAEISKLKSRVNDLNNKLESRKQCQCDKTIIAMK